MRDLPEWLQEFTDNLEDTEVPALAHTSQDSDSERPTKVTTRNHGICTHFPKDRKCEICKRSKITRAPCKKYTGEAVPRAEKFGDLITADHKVLNEESESRNNRRYAVVVQDLVTQWMAREMGSPRHVHNWRRRTREGPEPGCVLAPMSGGWRTQGVKGEFTSCRVPPVRRKEGRPGCPQG